MLTDRIEDRNIKGAMSYIRKADELCQLIAQSPIPIISFLQGEAIGLGAEIACASSHIVVTAEATLSIPQLFMGLIMLSIPRLVEKVGPGLAFLIQTSTPPKTPLTAPQMLAMGLAEAQVDHVEAGYQLIPKLLNAKILNKRLAEKTEGCRNISIILDSSHVRENLIRGTLPQQAPEWLRKLKARVDSIHNRDALNLVEKILNGAKPDLLETEMPQLLGHPDVFNFLRK
ncbi:MAG: enoyl-CoA hydratase/isomerase family protein [Deltaproteobacteria bacterium]|nr:MAG: enoyl-CoA hydratase/isomerase family protein [Deltaproteobacteria bacterium]